jgi:hypothetical protein
MKKRVDCYHSFNNNGHKSRANPKSDCTIVPGLENCTNNDNKDAYKYLDLRIKATRESADIKGYLDAGVLTTGQTSA